MVQVDEVQVGDGIGKVVVVLVDVAVVEEAEAELGAEVYEK